MTELTQSCFPLLQAAMLEKWPRDCKLQGDAMTLGIAVHMFLNQKIYKYIFL